jgi:MoaA/NifB/PqqE/SkfB family radical SAM enzyme
MADQSPFAEKLPRDLYVEVTNRCNSFCQTCIRTFEQLEPLRDLRLSELEAIVDQFDALDRVVLHGIGEPLLNTELNDMIRTIKERQPSARVLFNSNAILLNENWQKALIEVGLDEYRVSLDAATPATYARIRGVDVFDTVIRNVRHFAGLLRGIERPRLSLWSMAMRENLAELPALIDLAAEIGVPEVYVQRLVLIDHGLAQAEQSLYGQLRAQEEAALAQATERAYALNVAFRASGLTSPEKSLRGQTDTQAPTVSSQGRPYSACYRLWTTTYITANGNVLPCCISPFSTTDYAGLILGNVFDSSFAEIWNGEKYAARRAALHTAHPLHPCEFCGVNWTL